MYLLASNLLICAPVYHGEGKRKSTVVAHVDYCQRGRRGARVDIRGLPGEEEGGEDRGGYPWQCGDCKVRHLRIGYWGEGDGCEESVVLVEIFEVKVGDTRLAAWWGGKQRPTCRQFTSEVTTSGFWNIFTSFESTG